MGPAPLRGGWGKGEFPMIRGAHPQCEDQQGWGETFRGLGDRRGTQTAFPSPARAGEPTRVPGLNLRPPGRPPATLNLSPTPTPQGLCWLCP